MPNWTHRTTKAVLRSVCSGELPEPIANFIEDADLSAVSGFANKYWTITGDLVTLMSQVERDAVDAADLIVRRDAQADEIDALESFMRAFALILIDELNAHTDKTNSILDAIDGASNLSNLKTTVGAINDLPTRTPAQLKTALRNKLDT